MNYQCGVLLQFVDYGDYDEDCELPLMIPLTTARYGTTCKVEDYTGPDDAAAAAKSCHDQDNIADSSSQVIRTSRVCKGFFFFNIK